MPRINKNKKSHRAVIAVLILGLLSAITTATSYFYRCPIKQITGINCPSCQMTRAAMSLLRFDFISAWSYNPLIYLLALYIVLVTVQYIAGSLKKNNVIFYIATFMILALIRWITVIF